MPVSEILFETVANLSLPFSGEEKKYVDWLIKVAQNENKEIEALTYVFCSDEYLIEINRKYLNHDYYTDIITFPYKEGDVIESDIFISLDTVSSNAEKYNQPFEVELRRVIVHGLLHLMGYDDETDEDVVLMRKKEEDCLSLF